MIVRLISTRDTTPRPWAHRFQAAIALAGLATIPFGAGVAREAEAASRRSDADFYGVAIKFLKIAE